MSFSLTDDDIETQSNAVRSAISELINVSAYTLKEAFDSQTNLKKQIITLEDLLQSLKNIHDVPDFSVGSVKLQELRSRIGSLETRINELTQRFDDIEKAYQLSH